MTLFVKQDRNADEEDRDEDNRLSQRQDDEGEERRRGDSSFLRKNPKEPEEEGMTGK